MSLSNSGIKHYHPKTRSDWRNWLQKNHQTEEAVWFVYYKKESGKTRVSYDDAVEEALCFGWIDSLPKKIDENRSALKFTPRKPKSVWSQLNKKRVSALIRTSQMTPVGLEKVRIAKKNGSWNALNNSDQLASANKLPPDLEQLLLKNKQAHANFLAFSPSIRKQFLSWIDSAKREETRKTRMLQTLLMAAASKKPGPQGFKL